MKNSLVLDTRRMARVAHLAHGYIHAPLWADDYVLPETLPRYRYSLYFGDTAGPMGVYASAEDLFKWVQALNDGKLVKPSTLEEAYTPVTLNDGMRPGAGGGAGNGLPSHYGYGWFLQDGADGRTVRHTGDWRGYITCLIHNRKKDQTIIVLTNASDYSAIGIANGIENILNRRPYALPPMSIARTLGKTIQASGIETAVRQYHELKKARPDDYDFNSEGALNTLGYELLGRGHQKAAVEVFKLNVEAFPASWNVYDSLGEAYLAAGDKDLAAINYRRSVELNPENRGAVEALKKLGVN
jgi:CubicO group peptidase (beta-lactamase class C family)